MNDTFTSHDALHLASLIKSRQISPQELLESVIKKTAELNPQLNFISHKLYDYALKQIETGLPQGPFEGVPFLLKNLGGMCQGTPLTDGSRLMRDYHCPVDDEVVKRFRKSGLVIFGRSNTPEFGMSFTTEPVAHGATCNPWDVQLTAGGSSGGAAAAVAARVIPMAHASDGGGSIRVPASCCGLFGLKPSRARVPMGPLLGEAWGGFSTHHVLTLSVRDSAAMLDCIAGPEPGDPYYAPAQPASWLQVLETPVRKLKIGFLDSLGANEKPDSDVKKSLENTQKILTDLGHELLPIEFPADIQAMRRGFIIIAAANMQNFIHQTEKALGRSVREDEIETINHCFIEFAKRCTAEDYANAAQTIQFHSRKVAAMFTDIDVVLMPVTAQTARPLGELDGHYKNLKIYNAGQLAFAPYTGLANMTGQPAMSVPLFWTEKNIPVGSQFLAPFGDEVTLFQLARQLEEARAWIGKIPVF